MQNVKTLFKIGKIFMTFYHTEAVLFACLSSGWTTRAGIDCLAPRWEIT